MILKLYVDHVYIIEEGVLDNTKFIKRQFNEYIKEINKKRPVDLWEMRLLKDDGTTEIYASGDMEIFNK